MKTAEALVKDLKAFVTQTGLKRVVLGLSGGVDSALVAKLAVMALGKENVTGILMPNLGMSSTHSVADATLWAEQLGIEYHLVPIQHFVQNYHSLPWTESKEAYMNIQSRVRATILYHYANSHQALVLGTGNKTELTLGYFTKFGDGACDVLPIGNLYKTQVWEMAKSLDLPEAIVQKTPSAELQEGHTDEAEIGLSYAEIDKILKRFEEGAKAESKEEKMLEVRIKANQHKGQLPPLL